MKYKIEKRYNHFHDNYTYRLYKKTLFGWKEIEEVHKISVMIKRIEDIISNPICEGDVSQILLFMKDMEKNNGNRESQRTTH